MIMLFKDGTFKLRGKEVSVAGQTLPVVEGYKVGVRGGYVTVDGSAVPGFPDRNIKVMVSGADSVKETENSVAAAGPDESDAETIERIRTRFNMLNDMTKAVKKGDVRAMIVSGPPGVGKSHGVEEVLERYKTLEQLGARKTHEVIKGAMSPLGLYAALYKMQDAGNVVVFDDCDSIFSDELSLNILKAALDSKKTRKIHWNTDSHKLRAEGIPDSFSFKASAIFITNLKFDKVKGKLREHLEALESRCHYMDLTIDTDREKMLRIRQVIQDGMLNEYKLSDEVKEDIIDFVDANKGRLRELSLRSVLKVADLAVAFPNNWEIYAENTVMRRV
ncbi:MAG: ATP-binding protein [Schleiferiaceae bacterium]|nr:ATP-binding protein [Schleiferiaceae bacterium]